MTRKVTNKLYDEWILSNQHDRLFNTTDCVILSQIQLVAYFDFFLKTAISPDCNIQIDWNKRHSKVTASYCDIDICFMSQLLKSTSNKVTFSLHIFSQTPCNVLSIVFYSSSTMWWTKIRTMSRWKTATTTFLRMCG